MRIDMDNNFGDFYPRSPCGERRVLWMAPSRLLRFLSTLSLRRATSNKSSEHPNNGNFYPRSPCGERPYDTYAKVLRVNISIHALLAESDRPDEKRTSILHYISIHALLAESDAPSPPRREYYKISIHALLAESDGLGWEV